ncbi:phospholipid-binding protein [Betaproteobacteria bacterium GR16-43]|nr:phospholipid-binding protein [Betaproteobacteria bacterium GR16-43]
MKLAIPGFADGAAIAAKHAFCAADPTNHVRMSENRNPALSWSEAPAATRSFAILCHDPDVPSVGTDVNQAGRTIPASLPRVDFFHWVLVDLPASVTSIGEGEFSSAIVANGKPGPAAARGSRQGVNDYTGWFADDPAMAGQYFGYDGPCPPWNDEIVHHYVFTVFALDVARLPVEGAFTGPDARKAMEGHVLAQASVTGLYALNPKVKF